MHAALGDIVVDAVLERRLPPFHQEREGAHVLYLQVDLRDVDPIADDVIISGTVAGLRSPMGASAELLDRALCQDFTLLLSVALVPEYWSICKAPAQRVVSGLDESEIGTIISASCAVAEPVRSRFLRRPQLRDTADEMVLEAAINGHSCCGEDHGHENRRVLRRALGRGRHPEGATAPEAERRRATAPLGSP